VEKFCRAGQATDDNVAHAHLTMDNQIYQNNYSISTLTMFTLKHLKIKQYIQYIGCLLLFLCVDTL